MQVFILGLASERQARINLLTQSWALSSAREGRSKGVAMAGTTPTLRNLK
jgi:hypothetical protein